MGKDDLSVRILSDIREDMRGLRQEIGGLHEQVRQEIGGLRDEMRQAREEANTRFEVIETTLRDLAEQLVMLSRGIKVAIEARADNQTRLDDHERRINDLERRLESK
jgi:chromosome segregation ATPase